MENLFWGILADYIEITELNRITTSAFNAFTAVSKIQAFIIAWET